MVNSGAFLGVDWCGFGTLRQREGSILKTTITHEEHARLQALWKIYEEHTKAAALAIATDQVAHRRHDRLAAEAIKEIRQIQGM